MFNWFRKKEYTYDYDWPILPRNRVLGKLLGVFPEVNPSRVYLADNYYVMPSKAYIEQLLFTSQVDDRRYISEMQDCDDYALLLHAYVIRARYKMFEEDKIKKNKQYPLAFGQIWYKDKKTSLHANNICITHDVGILLIEPQADKIWKPKGDIFIDFIRI